MIRKVCNGANQIFIGTWTIDVVQSIAQDSLLRKNYRILLYLLDITGYCF